MASTLLNYFPAAVPEDDLGFDRTRADLLRRRVRLYCVVLAVIAVLRGVDAASEIKESVFHLIAAIIETTALTSIYLRLSPRRPMAQATLSQLSMALVAATGVLWLIVARLDGVGADTTLLWRHLLAAAILPWTFREAAIAAGLLASANVAILMTDLLRNLIGIGSFVFFLVVAPGMAAPGIVLSWWRHSKFRTHHRLSAESALYRSLSREMESARRVHENCMPREITSGRLQLHYLYQPYRQLGGDLLYVFPASTSARTNARGDAEEPKRDRDVFTLLVLDVAGHGIAAALTVNRIVGELERMLAEAETRGETALVTPAVVARGLNRYVRVTLAHHGLFATAFIARVDVRHSRLTWVNCGHPPAFLHVPGLPLRRLDSEAMMLGVTDEEDLGAVDQVEAFEVNSTLLAMTDGATEARPPGGASLRIEGVERLVERVRNSGQPASGWPRWMGDTVGRYRQGLSDDDTLFVAVSHLAAAQPVNAEQAVVAGDASLEESGAAGRAG